MRKFTLFLMSLFLTVGAMAQQFDANKTYRIKSADGKYMTIGDTNAGAYGNVYVTDLDEENGDQKFSLISSNGNWKIKSDNGEYFSIAVGNGVGWNVNATTDEAQAMEIIFEATGNVNEFYLRKDNSSYFKTGAVSDDSSPYYHVYHDANSTARVAFTVEEIGLPVYTVTYKYSWNGVIVKTVTNEVVSGNAYPAYDLNLYAASYENVPTGTVTDNAEVTITLTFGELPFEFYATVEDIDNNGWYNLVMHSNHNTGNGTAKYRTYVGAGSETTLAWGEKRTLTNAGDDYYWAFVGDPFNGFRVVNKSAEGKILSSNGTANPVLLQEEGLADGYNTTWTIAARKYDVNTGGDFIKEGAWFCLKYPGSNNYVNANANNGNVAFWSDNDNGSAILAVKPLEINAAADVATYYIANNVMNPSAIGAEVYYANGINEAGNMGLEQITDDVIPAETGIVVKFDTDENVVYAPEITSNASSATISGNLLKGTTKRTLIEKEANNAYYVLGMKEGVGFYNAVNGENENEFYNGAFKAYLEMPALSGTAAFYGFDWAGTTGIENVEVENADVIYDLTGRQVNAVERGIYIINGKKVLVK